jgi:hypothetical protein
VLEIKQELGRKKITNKQLEDFFNNYIKNKRKIIKILFI